jgi:thiamine biosynthesis lipoprotein
VLILFSATGRATANPPRSAKGPARRDFWARLVGGRPERNTTVIRVSRPAMACQFEVILPETGAPSLGSARDALASLDEIEARLSVFRETSEISRINRSASQRDVECDADLMAFLVFCQELSIATDGAFDITSTPLSRCWGFLRREGRLPSNAELETALAGVGASKLHLDRANRTARFRTPGLELNLGAVGKGYALDLLAAKLRDAGVSEALLCAGKSSVLAVDGEWAVDVRSPQIPDRPLAHLTMRRGALGTSGAGEQFVIVDGRRYGHIIDPRTGWPAVGVLSASVVAPEAARADALATAFFVGGIELARRYCAEHPDVIAIITPDDAMRRPQVFGHSDGTDVEVV